MSSSPSLARLSGCLAAAAPRAVLLRRGPSRVVQMIAWDTARDEFEPGQWLRAQVSPLDCDLSPDGALFVCAAQRLEIHHLRRSARRRRREAQGPLRWTALSRPPWFTALAWGPGGNGGRFAGPRRLYLLVPDDAVREGPPTSGIELLPVRGDERAAIDGAEWADFDPARGDLVFARGHCVFRAPLPARTSLAAAVAAARQLADFSTHTFEARVAPPEATTWPELP